MPQFTKEDVCYLKHGERQIMARVFKPEGPGPFPAYVDLHGGAWNNGDLNDRTGLGEYLAQRVYVMVTLNFRHAADGYPTPLADIHSASRSAEPNPPAFSIGMKEKHDTYWKTEANMIEGNPMLILERGEKVVMPPAIWVQGRPDEVHDYHDPDGGFAGNEPERFVSNYRKAGGDIEITYFDNEKRNTEISHQPVYDFLKKHL